MRKILLAASLAVLTLSCDSPSGPGEPGVPAKLDIVSGDLQRATVGTELEHPLVVRVLDASGEPVAGQIINFRVSVGNGEVFGGAALTNRLGEARERWRLGTTATDTQRVEARAVDPATGEALVFATFRAVGTPGAPAAIAPLGAAQRSGSAGHELPDSLAARVTDLYDNPVPGAAVVWTVRAGGGSISPQTATSGAGGVARAAWTLGLRLDSVQVVDAAAGVALRTEFTATAAPPLGVQVVKVAGDEQTAAVGATLPVALRVAVRMVDGRPLRGVAVTWSAAQGSGSVAPATTITDANGEAAAQWTLGTAAGGQFATASAAGANPVTFAANATAGPATALVEHSGDGQQGSAGTVLAAPLVVRAQDAHGNPVPGLAVQWTVLTGGGSVNPASSQTGAAGTAFTQWALGSASESQTVRASSGALQPVTFTATAGTVGAISIHVRLPQPNAVAGDSLLVAAGVTSTPASISSFTAQVADRVVNLVPAGTESRGTLPLTGLPHGPLTLRVRALAVNGDSGVVDVPIIHDTPPLLSVAAPIMNTVARPQLRIDADCTDDSPAGCSAVRVDVNLNGTRTQVASGTTGVHTTVSLAAYDGKAVTVEVVGIDSRNLTTTVERPVFVESSPRWTEQASAGALLLDLDAHRVLFFAPDGSARIASRGGGGETVLRGADPFALTRGSGPRGWLHAQGAIFTTGDHDAPAANFDWRGGTLVSLPGAVLTLRASGEWAIWTGRIGYTDLYRRDLSSGATVRLATDAGNINQAVAANGDVVYWNSSYDVVRFRDGVHTPLTSDDNAVTWNVYPETDGTNVVFRSSTPCCAPQTYRIEMITADGSRVALTPSSNRGVEPRTDYAAKGGWVAYTLPDAAGIVQVWTRSPAGTQRQASLLGSASSIRALGPNGEAAFASGSRLYVTVAPYTSPPVDVGAAQNYVRLEWRDGQLLAFLGRSVFAVNY